MEQRRLQHIDFMRGIAIFNVVFIHLGLSTLDVSVLSICYRICIPVFIFVTGYTIGFSQNKPYISNLIKKISYMIHMLFIYQLITYLCVDRTIPMYDIFSNILSGKVQEIKNIAMWYLPFYVSLYFIIWTEVKLIKLIYDLIFDRLGKFNKLIYYVLLTIVSVIIAYQGFNLNISEGTMFASNPFYIKQAMITQVFAILGYLVFCLEKTIDDIETKIDTKQIDKYILFKTIFKIVILVISFVLFIFMSRKYGLIDILPMIWDGPISFYVSVTCALIFVYMTSKLICKVIGNFFLINFVSFCGKRSIHICALHLLVMIFIENYLKFVPHLLVLPKDKLLIELFIRTIVLMIMSIFISFAIENEK